MELLNLSIMTVSSVVFFALGHAAGRRDRKQLVAAVPLYTECICGHRVNSHHGRGGVGGCACLTKSGNTCACNFFIPVQDKGL